MTEVMTLPPNSLAGRSIGDNQPPLSEVLAEELAPDRARAAELLASAAAARIETDADAGKVADLIFLLRSHEADLDRKRRESGKPHVNNERIVNAAFGNIIGPLARARLDNLNPMLDKWRESHTDSALPTSIAAVGSRRKPEWVIEDLPAALDWLTENHPGPLAQSARTILGSIIHAAGVDAIERQELSIPGVRISISRVTQVR